jgi:hypothetical protein
VAVNAFTATHFAEIFIALQFGAFARKLLVLAEDWNSNQKRERESQHWDFFWEVPNPGFGVRPFLRQS